MTDEPFYCPNATPRLARVAKAGDHLFEFLKGSDHCVCELRGHGEFGIEAQFLLNGLYITRHFSVSR
jgi:hypothetical protein